MCLKEGQRKAQQTSVYGRGVISQVNLAPFNNSNIGAVTQNDPRLALFIRNTCLLLRNGFNVRCWNGPS